MLEIDPKGISTKDLQGYLLGSMGANFYCRASNNALFEVQKPSSKLGIGFDQLPEHVRNSSILSGNDLAKLANIECLPHIEEVAKFKENIDIAKILNTTSNNLETRAKLHHHCKSLLLENKLLDAWNTLLIEN